MVRRLIAWLFLSIAAGATHAQAAITHDADAKSHAGSPTSSLSWSHTCTGTNLILWVAVATGNNSPTVTYNGVSLTQVGSTSQSGYYTQLFYLVAPATGTHNVVVTLGSGTNVIFGQSSSYAGVKQSGVPDASTTATDAGTGNPLAPSVTPVADNAWTVASFVSSAAASPSAGTGATMRNEDHDASPMSAALFDSNGAVTPAGSYSMTLNAANNASYKAGVMASFAPALPPGTPTSPTPSDTATNETTSFTTACSASGATSWTIVGPDTTNPPTTNHTGVSNCAYAVSGLSNSTTYYWRAIAINDAGSTQGPVWSFSTVSSGGLTTLTGSDISWLGMMRVASHGNCWSGTGAYGRIAMRYVSGARHVLISQDATTAALTPCEFSDAATYDTDGSCTSNCPSSTLGSSPTLSFVGNWGFPNGALTSQIQISNISAANPTVITTSSAHGFSSGQLVYIPAISGIVPSTNAYWTVTVTDSTHFTIPLNVTTGGTPGPEAKVWRAYDPFHGVLGKCYGTGGQCGVSTGSTAMNDCPWAGGGGCELTDFFVQPGSPDKLFFTYGAAYGSTYHDWSLGFCTLDTTPQSGSTSPVTTCYGPFNPESYVGQTPSAGTNYTGLHAAQRILKHPDGSFDWTAAGGGASFGNGFGASGPILFNITDGLPTTSTAQGYGNATIKAQTKWLAYYNMTCHDATQPNCGGTEQNADGSIPGGHHIWAFRLSGYPYVWEGSPCAINYDNPLGQPLGCGGATNYSYVRAQSSYIDPLKNSGVGTWGELDRLGGAVWFQGESKQGVLFFVGMATNHLAGNTTNCTITVNGNPQNVAHTSYCDGQYKGSSGFTCAGANDMLYGHPGDTLSPQYQCQYVDIATGPSDTFREPAILIYNPDDLVDVANGATDYAVDPASVVYPLTDMSDDMAFAPVGTNGVAMSWGGCIQDPENIHIVYCTAPQADNGTNPGYPDVVIHVFKIAG